MGNSTLFAAVRSDQTGLTGSSYHLNRLKRPGSLDFFCLAAEIRLAVVNAPRATPTAQEPLLAKAFVSGTVVDILTWTGARLKFRDLRRAPFMYELQVLDFEPHRQPWMALRGGRRRRHSGRTCGPARTLSSFGLPASHPESWPLFVASVPRVVQMHPRNVEARGGRPRRRSTPSPAVFEAGFHHREHPPITYFMSLASLMERSPYS